MVILVALLGGILALLGGIYLYNRPTPETAANTFTHENQKNTLVRTAHEADNLGTQSPGTETSTPVDPQDICKGICDHHCNCASHNAVSIHYTLLTVSWVHTPCSRYFK